MEVEGRDVLQPAAGVEVVAHALSGAIWFGALHHGGAKPIAIFDGNAEAFHHGTRVFAEALLPGNERIAVVGVLHCALFQIGRDADVMVGTDDEAGSFALEKLPNGFDLFRGCFLLSDHVIEAEDHECVGVCEDALVDRQSLAGLVDALIDGDGLVSGFADELLEAQSREVEELERAGDALKEHLF